VKKKLKGFTLVELIMVLALVSIIMYSVLQLMDPVSKYFVRSSNFEGSTACLDNIKRAIEGNLKYADRVWSYNQYKPYDDPDDPLPSDQLKNKVRDFYDYFFGGRKALDTAGYIYALVLDNTKLPDSALLSDTYSDTEKFNAAGKNSGRIILYKFWFNNYDSKYSSAEDVANSCEEGYVTDGAPPTWEPAGITPEPGMTDWYVNKKLYSNYEYRFDMGLMEPVLDEETGEPVLDDEGNPKMKLIGETAEFVPSNFVITISMTELRKNNEGQGLIRVPMTQTSSSSFSMKNVLDSSVGYTKTGIDEYLTLASGASEEDDDIVYKMVPKNRYTNMQTNPAKSFDGMYFIFTIPETTYTNPAGITHQKKLTS